MFVLCSEVRGCPYFLECPLLEVPLYVTKIAPDSILITIKFVFSIFNSRCACIGGLWYLSCASVCLCVCVSVATLASTSFVSTVQVRYVRLSFRIYSRGFSIKPYV